jgi:heme-degrading monooxygenase HmoA
MWSQIAHTEGLIGQVGGWNVKDPEEACVLSLWSDRRAYEAFFKFVHDSVTYKNKQRDTYESLDISFGTSLVRMPGACRGLVDAIHGARVLRVADCVVRPSARNHFIDMQLTTWAPGMEAAEGMLGGAFSAMAESDRRFLVTTLWASEALHEAYAEDVLPGLQVVASGSGDLEAIQGRLIRLEPAWRIAGLAPG